MFPLWPVMTKSTRRTENRFYVLGQTDSGRLLFLVFTVRKDKLRIISARDMNKKERRVYQTHEEDSPVQK